MEKFSYGQGYKETCDKLELDILCRIYSDDVIQKEEVVKE